MLAFLLKVIRGLRDFVRFVRDWLATVLEPFWEWLARVLGGIVRLIVDFLRGIAKVVRRFFGKDDPTRRVMDPGGEHARILFGTLALAVIVYGPASTWTTSLSPAWFIALCVAVFAAAWMATARIMGTPDPGKVRDSLRRVERRAGLMWHERVLLVAALAVLWLSFGNDARLLPLAAASVVGAGVLLLGPNGRIVGRTFVPTVTIPTTDPTAPDAGEGLEKRSFEWDLSAVGRADRHSMAVMVDVAELERHRDLEPKYSFQSEGATDLQDMAARWVVGGIRFEVDQVAATMSRLSLENRYSTFMEVSNVVAFAQQAITYELDETSTGVDEYWRYPIETVYDQEGDCEDSSILAAAILHRMGHTVALLASPHHIAIGVKVPGDIPGEFVVVAGHRMYYAETTAPGWSVGELPTGTVVTGSALVSRGG